MRQTKKGGLKSVVFGLIAGLILGWWIFPNILFSSREQPFHFSHQAHLNQDLNCTDCHFYRSDGSFSGTPSLESCAECHEKVVTGTPDEEYFVQEFVRKDKPIPWEYYQRQPDNVYFSHIAHNDLECTRCHPDVGYSENMPPVAVNKLTGYSRQTMTMDECERCHALENASNACYVCHK